MAERVVAPRQEDYVPKRIPDIADLEARRALSAPRMIYGLHIFVRDRVIEGLERRGHESVTFGHGVLLRNMDFAGTPLSVIAQRAGVSRQAIAKVTADLVELGYVETSTSRDDGRVKIAKLTRRGIRLAKDSIEIFEEIEEAFREIAGDAKLESLRRTLDVLCVGLGITRDESGSALGS